MPRHRGAMPTSIYSAQGKYARYLREREEIATLPLSIASKALPSKPRLGLLARLATRTQRVGGGYKLGTPCSYTSTAWLWRPRPSVWALLSHVAAPGVLYQRRASGLAAVLSPVVCCDAVPDVLPVR